MGLVTNHPVALESLEFIHPAPHKDIPDKSTNLDFVRKIRQGSLLDLGCGGGKFVHDCWTHGIDAFGIEGSPHYFNNKWSEWVNIPENLFLCDITKPFDFGVKFGMITAWEVLEHIPEDSLVAVFENVKKHLDGLFVVSLSNKKCMSADGEVDYHVTQKDEKWWVEQFERAGFVRDAEMERYFDGTWVRDERNSYKFIWRTK